MKRPCQIVLDEKDTMNEQSQDTEIHQLIVALSDPSVNIRHQAIRSLGKLGRPAVEPLVQALAGDSDNCLLYTSDAADE